MSVDYLTHIDNESLIKSYEEIGEKLLLNLEYDMTENEFLVMMAVSKRKLTQRTKFKFGLPKSKEWQSGLEKKYNAKMFK